MVATFNIWNLYANVATTGQKIRWPTCTIMVATFNIWNLYTIVATIMGQKSELNNLPVL